MKPTPHQHPFMLAFANFLIGTAILSVVLSAVALWYGIMGHSYHRDNEPGTLTLFGIAGIMIGLAILPIIHILVLTRVRPMTTHTTRDLIVNVVLIVGGVIFLILLSLDQILSGGIGKPDYAMFLFSCMFFAFVMMIGLRMNTFIAFSIPSNWISIIPIFISYLGLYVFMFLFFGGPLSYGFRYWGSQGWESVRPVLFIGFIVYCFYILIAGTIFPTHRRIAELWRPKRLPKIKPRTGGFTLIELLIGIAIVAIISAAVMTVTSRARAFTETMEVSRESLALIEDELAVLRTQPSLPAPGVYKVDPKVAELHARLAPLARVEISQTSGPLVQARVTVDLKKIAVAPELSMATLIAPRKEAKQ